MLRDTLVRLAREYPSDLVGPQLEDIPRIAFHIGLVLARAPRSGVVCDIGGGVGLFSLGCAALGLRSVLVDDFADEVGGHAVERLLAPHRAHGVTILSRDALLGLPLAPASASAVTCFHSMEHWHHSPRKLFADAVNALVPGGLFVLAGPNAVNLRKRITVPLGYGNWSALAQWYDADRFRGHVREPVLEDLHAIACRLGLSNISLFGRNWLGRSNRRAVVRVCTRWADRLLQLRPSLCSDIYVMGTRPAAALDATPVSAA